MNTSNYVVNVLSDEIIAIIIDCEMYHGKYKAILREIAVIITPIVIIIAYNMLPSKF